MSHCTAFYTLVNLRPKKSARTVFAVPRRGGPSLSRWTARHGDTPPIALFASQAIHSVSDALDCVRFEGRIALRISLHYLWADPLHRRNPGRRSTTE